MKTNTYIKTVILVFICTTAIANGAFCQTPDGFHILNYLFAPYRTLKFKDVPSDLQFIKEFPIEALKNDPLIKDIRPAYYQDNPNLAIQAYTGDGEFDEIHFNYWVHTSVSDAELATLSSSVFWRLNGLPLYHSSDLEREEIGNNCWYSRGSNLLYFIRNNVRIELRDISDLPNPELVLAIAKKIDTMLLESEKVANASLIQAPIINSIEQESGSLEPGSRASFRVIAFDPKGQLLTYHIYGDAPVRITTIGRDLRSDIPQNDNFIKCWVWNEDYMISSIDFILTPSAVTEDTVSNPDIFTLFHNTPNPFNPATLIRFDLHEPADVRLDVYDMLGRAITTLVDEPLVAGNHTAHFDGAGLSSGVYVYRLSVGGKSETGRMTLMK